VETVEARVLEMESVSEIVRSWVLKSLESGVPSPNLDVKNGRKQELATVPYLEDYYPKYSCNPRFNRDEQILVDQHKVLPRYLGRSNGCCKESVQEAG
jgi:hypothetical protein